MSFILCNHQYGGAGICINCGNDRLVPGLMNALDAVHLMDEAELRQVEIQISLRRQKLKGTKRPDRP